MNDPEVLQILPKGQESFADVADPADLPWVTELPSESTFSSAIQGSSPADTALRQRDALTVLIGVVHGLGAKQARERDRIRPRVDLARFVLQRRSLDRQGLYSPSEVTSTSAEAIGRRKAVRDQVLKAFFSKGTIAAYQATPDYGASEDEYPVPPWVATDVGKARGGHGDLSLFGLQLGQTLQLPTCTGDEMKRAWSSALADMGATGGARGAPETCVGDMQGQLLGGKNLFAALSGLTALGGDAAAVKGGQQVGVGLAENRCPEWVSPCSLSATVIDGVMVGATIPVGRKGGALTKAASELQRKYGRADGSRPNRCTYQTYGSARASNGELVQVATGRQTVEGTALSWSKVPGLYISYVPYDGTGCVGRVYVELASVHTLAGSEAARAETMKPKM